MLIGVCLIATAAPLGGHVLETALSLSGNEDIGVDDFQDLLVDRRSLNVFQTSSVDGETYQYYFYTRAKTLRLGWPI